MGINNDTGGPVKSLHPQYVPVIASSSTSDAAIKDLVAAGRMFETMWCVSGVISLSSPSAIAKQKAIGG